MIILLIIKITFQGDMLIYSQLILFVYTVCAGRPVRDQGVKVPDH